MKQANLLNLIFSSIFSCIALSFDLQRTDLLGQPDDLPGIDIESLDGKAMCELQQFGSQSANVIVNRLILEATISFIKSILRQARNISINSQRTIKGESEVDFFDATGTPKLFVVYIFWLN